MESTTFFRPIKSLSDISDFIRKHHELAKEYDSEITGKLNLSDRKNGEFILSIANELKIPCEPYKTAKGYFRRATYQEGKVKIIFTQRMPGVI